MTMVTDIQLGSYSIGAISLTDERYLRGVGGALSPALEVQLDVRLQPVMDLALGSLRCELWLPLRPPIQVGSADTMRWLGGFCAHERSATSRSARFRFPLSEGHVRVLEELAMQSGERPLPLELRFEVEAQLIRWAANTLDRDERAPALGLDPNYGVITHAATFMTASAHPLQVEISRSHWIEQVFPGIGASGLRLVAVRLPAGMVDADLVRQFDRARQHLDAGRATEAIHACRAVRETFAKSVGIAGPQTVRAFAERSGLDPQRPGIAFAQEVWDALARLTDKASHPIEREFTLVEARACVLVTAALLEALARLPRR